MADKQNVRVDTGFGIIWFIGWLFTIGYLKLQFWTGVLAVVIWPYCFGVSFRWAHREALRRAIYAR